MIMTRRTHGRCACHDASPRTTPPPLATALGTAGMPLPLAADTRAAGASPTMAMGEPRASAPFRNFQEVTSSRICAYATRSFRRRIIGIRDLVFGDKISPKIKSASGGRNRGHAMATPTRHAVGKEQAAPRRRPRCAAANADAPRARGRRDASKAPRQLAPSVDQQLQADIFRGEPPPANTARSRRCHSAS